MYLRQFSGDRVSDHVITKGYMRKRSLLALSFLALFATLAVFGAVAGRKAERTVDANLAGIDMALVSLSEISAALNVLSQEPNSQEAYVAHGKIRRASHGAEDALKIIEAAVANNELYSDNMATLTQVALNPITDFKQVLHFGRLLNQRKNTSNERTLIKISSLSLEITNRLLGVFSTVRQKESEYSRLSQQMEFFYILGSITIFCIGALISIRLVYLPMERFVLSAHEQLKNERDRAENASRAKTIFLASMSHEIRTPLNGIIGLTETLADANLTREQKDTIKLVNKSGYALLEILNNVLSTSRGEVLGADEDKEIFCLRDLCQDVVALFTAEATNKGNKLRFEDAQGAEPVWIRARSGQIRQVVTNLVSNAIKFTKEGTVTVSLSATRVKDNYHVAIGVSDDGIGIAPHEIEAVFKEFQQANEDVMMNYGGTGLGLSISKNIATSMGGDIVCESELGVGTTFTFSFPVQRAHAPQMTVPVATSDAVRTMKVLIVDDNRVNVLVTERILKRIGIDAQNAYSARDALGIVRTWHPDVVLMDIRMPDMNGLEATSRIKEMEAQGVIPPVQVIGLSANHSKGDIDSGLAAGMCTYVSKPINAAKLAEALQLVSELDAA